MTKEPRGASRQAAALDVPAEALAFYVDRDKSDEVPPITPGSTCAACSGPLVVVSVWRSSEQSITEICCDNAACPQFDVPT